MPGIEVWAAIVGIPAAALVAFVPTAWLFLKAALPVCKRLNTMYQQVNGMSNPDDGQMKQMIDRMDRLEKNMGEMQRHFMDYLTHRK